MYSASESVSVQLPQPGKVNVMLIVYSPAKLESLKSAIHETRVPLPAIGSSGTFAVVFTGDVVEFVS